MRIERLLLNRQLKCRRKNRTTLVLVTDEGYRSIDGPDVKQVDLLAAIIAAQEKGAIVQEESLTSSGTLTHPP